MIGVGAGFHGRECCLLHIRVTGGREMLGAGAGFHGRVCCSDVCNVIVNVLALFNPRYFN